MISTIFMINAYKCITPWKYTVCYHETIRSQKLDSSSVQCTFVSHPEILSPPYSQSTLNIQSWLRTLFTNSLSRILMVRTSVWRGTEGMSSAL